MNIIKDGAIMAIFLFIICSVYLFTSEPFHEITTELSGVDAASDTETQNTFTTIDTVYAMFFVILASIPIIWFILRVFQREPQWGYYQ